MRQTEWDVEPTDASYGEQHAWPWVVGMDDDVAVDLTPQLAIDETPTSVTATLYRLRIAGEADNVDVTEDYCVGVPIVDGNVVKQRVSGLVRGRVYRLYLLHGAAGNIRAASVVIEVNP